MDWSTHPDRDAWTATRTARYAGTVAQLHAQRLSYAPLDSALRDCLQAGRPFCFCRWVDTVARVRLRDEWEGLL